MNIRRNVEKLIFADTLAAEFIAGVLAIAQGGARLNVPEDRTLASIAVFIGTVRLIALVSGQLWLRLTVAYFAVFTWTYFVLFVFLEQPSEHFVGAVASIFINTWLAWRLQSDRHARKNFIKNAGQ